MASRLDLTSLFRVDPFSNLFYIPWRQCVDYSISTKGSITGFPGAIGLIILIIFSSASLTANIHVKVAVTLPQQLLGAGVGTDLSAVQACSPAGGHSGLRHAYAAGLC